MTGLGIATDKILLLSGMPTQITAHFEEIRVTLPQLLRRLDAVDAEVVTPPGEGDATRQT